MLSEFSVSRLRFLSPEATTRNPREMTHPVTFISTRHCDTQQFLTRRWLTFTWIRMERFSFHFSVDMLGNRQRPNHAMERTANRRAFTFQMIKSLSLWGNTRSKWPLFILFSLHAD